MARRCFPSQHPLVAHKLTGVPLDDLTGRGTGVADAALVRKRDVLARAAARTPAALAPEAAMRQYGGFEMAMMTGAMLGAADAGRLVLVDGFIATASALVAETLDPSARAAMVFAHLSDERGHGALLAHMGAQPLLQLSMRLGEGTGAALAWPLVKSAAAMLSEMASFDSAGISGPA